MEEKELYTFEEAEALFDKYGLGRYKRAEEKYRQFAKNGSSMHVKTKKYKRFCLYAVDMDFTNILNNSNKYGYDVRLIKDTEEIKEIGKLFAKNNKKLEPSIVDPKIEKGKNERKRKDRELFIKENKDVVLCLSKGNQINHPTTAEQYLPHEIMMFNNSNFEKVLQVLALNKANLKEVH